MRKLILLLTLIITTTAFVFAQDDNKTPFFQAGVKVGVNLTKISGLSFINSYRLNYIAGGYATLNFGGLLGLQPELEFSQVSATTSSSFSDLYKDIGTIDLSRPHLQYMSIPLLVNFGGDEFKFQFGPQYSILMNSTESFWTNGKQAFSNGDFAFDLGIWINLPFRLNASVRYVIGLENLNNINNSDTWKSQQLQIGVGFRL